MDYKFGCKPSPLDIRDFPSTAGIPTDIALPSKTNNRAKIKYVRNQNQYGTCVGFGNTALKNIQELNDSNLPDQGFSPLYLYTECKQIDGIPDQEGTYIRCAMKVLQSGILAEKDMPYSLLTDIHRLPTITDSQKQKAYPYRIASYAQVMDNDLIALKQAIFTQGGAIGGLLVTSSFVNPEGGKYINYPNGSYYGGHCVAFIDYNDNLEYTFRDGKHYKGFILIQNSWGNWADGGFAWIPYDLLKWKMADTGQPFIYEIWTTMDYINNPAKPDVPVEKLKYYRVQLGAYSIKDNAYKAQQDMFNKIGWKAYVTYIEPYWKLQFGAFSIKSNAQKMSEQLKSFGFNNWVTYY